MPGQAPGARNRRWWMRAPFASLIEVFLPVRRYFTVGSRCGLAGRMRVRRGQSRAFDEIVGLEAVQPIFTRLEARDHGVIRIFVMFSRVLTRRTIAAPDVTAFRAATEMQPPAVARQTFGTSGSARFCLRIYFAHEFVVRTVANVARTSSVNSCGCSQAAK
jgi:hypothetical protein